MENKIFLFLIFMLFTGCDALFLGRDEAIHLEDNFEPPPALSDGWQVSTLEEEKLNASIIHNVVEFLNENNQANVHSLLIVRNNKLILEAYFNGWNRNRRHDLRSATKSITSCMVGIAIDQGYIESTEEPVFGFFPEYSSIDNWDERKTTIPIRHFLQMRTGLECNDWYESSRGNEEKMYHKNDWIKFVLDLPVSRNSGENFSYCTGAPVVLGGVIAKASGMEVPEFADKYLFGPLGITNYAWQYMPNGRTDTGGHIHMLPRDMAKFGLLFLNRGIWNGQQIVSADWVNESVTPTEPPSSNDSPSDGYGYLWWTQTRLVRDRAVPMYYANGNGGQLIFVVPSLNAVVVFTGGKYNESMDVPFGLLHGRILPAME